MSFTAVTIFTTPTAPRGRCSQFGVHGGMEARGRRISQSIDVSTEEVKAVMERASHRLRLKEIGSEI